MILFIITIKTKIKNLIVLIYKIYNREKLNLNHYYMEFIIENLILIHLYEKKL